MDDLTERIDLYLNGALSEEETAAFEQQLAQDKDLAKKVRLQQKTFDLLEAYAWVNTKDRVAELNKNRAHPMTMFLKVAAVFVGVLIGSYVFMNYQHSDTALYADYFTSYPDRITNMGETDDAISAAMDLYNQADYKKATIAFAELRAQDDPSELILLYEVIALTEANQSEEALTLLNQYQSLQTTMQDAFEWQKILCLLANKEGEEAYQLLLIYLENDYSYQKTAAQELKQDLESIWR